MRDPRSPDEVPSLHDSITETVVQAQEDAFVQGVGKGYREGTKQQGLSRFLQDKIANADNADYRRALVDVQHFLQNNGCALWRGEGWNLIPSDHGLILLTHDPHADNGGEDGGT